MSVVINGAQRWQPPTVQPLSPWQQALAGKQDTGGGESAQGPWSDNTPVQGGGATLGLGGERQPFTGTWGTFGTTYADPGGGWNPWSLYDGREGFDGTAADGFYNAAADTKKGWGPNGTPESDRDRVWRMTLDDLGPNPGGQPPERVKAAFLNNVARLKRDYLNTPGMGAQAWAGSAFAGYDRLAQGGQGVGGAAQAAAQAGSSAVQQAAGQQGGTGMAYPDGGSGAAAASQAGAAAAAAAAAALKNKGVPPKAGGLFNADAGTQAGQYGQYHTNDIAGLLQDIQSDPKHAATLWRAMQGQSGPRLGRMAQDRDSLYGQALQVLTSLGGLPGMGSSADLLSQFAGGVGQPGQLLGLGDQMGQKLGGMDLTGFTSEQLDLLLSSIAALKGVNMGRLGRANMGTQMDTLQQQDWLRNSQDTGTDDQNYSGDLGTTDYGRSLMQYLGAK